LFGVKVVCFQWLAQRWQVPPVFAHNDVVVLQK
jgi:hypothetical protein